jgi:hypothetical protein
MTFDLKVLASLEGGHASATAEICLGDHVETFPLITTRWPVERYEQQWRRTIEALVAGEVQRGMLITDIQPPEESAGVSYWALFRVATGVVLQERFMRTAPTAVNLEVPEVAESVIPPRVQGTPDEHVLVSEWEVSELALRDFLRKSGHAEVKPA